jgi:hypothetical protein
MASFQFEKPTVSLNSSTEDLQFLAQILKREEATYKVGVAVEPVTAEILSDTPMDKSFSSSVADEYSHAHYWFVYQDGTSQVAKTGSEEEWYDGRQHTAREDVPSLGEQMNELSTQPAFIVKVFTDQHHDEGTWSVTVYSV